MAWFSSLSNANGRENLVLNFWWDETESGLTPSTTTPFWLRPAIESRKSQASRVHPDVLSLG